MTHFVRLHNYFPRPSGVPSVDRQYRVLSIRRGGMGVVYIVEDLRAPKRGISVRLALKTFQDRRHCGRRGAAACYAGIICGAPERS